jgi:hypothetical protein
MFGNLNSGIGYAEAFKPEAKECISHSPEAFQFSLS